MAFKKRRPVKTISKNQARITRRATEERLANRAGSLLTRFPFVERLDIQMEFASSRGELLGSEHRTFQSNDLLNFSVDCPGRCGNGRMDMETVLTQIFNNRQTSRDVSGRCRETLFAGSDETCNVEIKCKIMTQYAPAGPDESV